ncbi:IS110 family transposase [uncultured Faecalibaculum sp.]|uniref:IS110 family transposase n=3 Tax=uncultured Faecalibaculum sp. TaxID=1729681 RepID=UPI0027301F18|nr:IS110 family transposase [uncultured Faecalibaculum sp.]
MNDVTQTVLLVAGGLDVHKSFVIVVIKSTSEDGTVKTVKKRFSTFRSDLEDLRDWLLQNDCHHVCMESTGKYWIPVYNVLEPAMKEVRVCNPKWLSLVKGEKDDNKDAARICDLYRNGMTKSSYIPNKQIRILRELTRLRQKYVQQRTSDHNRLINCLTVSNYKLDMVFSNVRGKSASRIVDLILSGKPYTDEDILKCVYSRCKAPREDILRACHGFELDKFQRQKLQIIQSNINNLTKEIEKLDQLIMEACEDHKEYVRLLMTIPGISEISARKLLAEFGTEMDQFGKASRAAKWAGLAPGSDESAGKIHSRHITKGGKYLKPVLIEAAWAAVRSKNPYYRCKFEVLSLRLGKKRAIVAIGRKMIVSIFHMFLNMEEWYPKDCDDFFVPRGLSVKKETRILNKTVNTLKAMGMTDHQILKTIAQGFEDSEISDEEGNTYDLITGEYIAA